MARWKLTPNDGIHAAEKPVIQLGSEAVARGIETHMKTVSKRLVRTQISEIQRQSSVDHDAAIHARIPPAIRMMINQSKIIGLLVKSIVVGQ